MASSSSRLDLALSACAGAADITLTYFSRRSFATEQKHDGSPVTTADREAEGFFRRAVGAAFPDDGFLGEEFGELPGRSGYRWIVDPIDGTTSFVHGVPLWGTLVGVEHQGRMVAGVIHMPALGETVSAAAGEGAWYTDRHGERSAARVTTVDRLSDAMVCLTSFDYFTKTGREEAFHRIARSSRTMRGWSDCYAHLLIATGRADAVIEPAVHPWDMAASLAIIPEAGGACTDWNGLESAASGHGILSNGRFHASLVSELRPFVRSAPAQR